MNKKMIDSTVECFLKYTDEGLTCCAWCKCYHLDGDRVIFTRTPLVELSADINIEDATEVKVLKGLTTQKLYEEFRLAEIDRLAEETKDE